ncbi:hypothetical protein JQN58_31450 [Aneurinibacillus sp. BA2021]|nr:hypothetical protein [Aneurinibacillus sp. BA2021]
MNIGSLADWFAAAGTILASGTAIVLATRSGRDRRNELADRLGVRVNRKQPTLTTTVFEVEYSTPPELFFYNLQFHWKAAGAGAEPMRWNSKEVTMSAAPKQTISIPITTGATSTKAPVYISFQDMHGRQFVRDLSNFKYISANRLKKLTDGQVNII